MRHSWKDEVVSELPEETFDQAFSKLQKHVQDLGFDYYSYTLIVATPVTKLNTRIFSNFPDAWEIQRSDKFGMDRDPILKYGLNCTKPFIWDVSDPQNKEYWQTAAAHKIHAGWSQAVRDHRGCIGIFSAASHRKEMTLNELNEITPKMIWIAQTAHATLSNKIYFEMLPNGAAKLSNREKEILLWSAEGKTVTEVAMILNISERNIVFHIQNAMKKLNTSNKTQTVVTAALLGLIPRTLI
ncbi:autoinducer binding domain-containing protein [Undibacterium sp. Dicai25W]|uniref:autoinducer binding domain-containing protein n=1 Tax=Undibacterium sp. Dicai25W TaxID=3413034 RepID=UPI003BEF96B5